MKIVIALLATILTATWGIRPPAEQVREYRLYESVNGVWIWRASPIVPPFKFSANKGTRTYAVTAVNSLGESPRSASVSVRIKH